MTHWRRLSAALAALVLVIVVGTIGYVVLGFGVLDAAYQTVTTVSTVGFREVEPLSAAGQVFTMVLILVGAGTALYAFGVLIETFIEGRLNELLGRRRMEQSIASMHDHVIICGWGRVGSAIGNEIVAAARDLVVVELDPGRAAAVLGPRRSSATRPTTPFSEPPASSAPRRWWPPSTATPPTRSSRWAPAP